MPSKITLVNAIAIACTLVIAVSAIYHGNSVYGYWDALLVSVVCAQMAAS